MFGGMRYDQDELRFMARHVACQIEREIATCKFIEKAKENNRRRYRYTAADFSDETVCDR
jgi:hypothetical protein